VAQVVECLPSKPKALGSNSNTPPQNGGAGLGWRLTNTKGDTGRPSEDGGTLPQAKECLQLRKSREHPFLIGLRGTVTLLTPGLQLTASRAVGQETSIFLSHPEIKPRTSRELSKYFSH
jgi:hypothetical protein